MSKRTSMLSTTIRDLIAPVLRMCPPECGIVSITRVEVSDDASHATAYVSALQEPEKALKYLHSQMNTLQRSFSDLHRKKIPMLRFRLDKELEQSIRLDELLEKASKELRHDPSGTQQE